MLLYSYDGVTHGSKADPVGISGIAVVGVDSSKQKESHVEVNS